MWQVLNIGFVAFTYVKCRTYGVLQDQLLFFYELRVSIFIWLSFLVLYVAAACLSMLSHHFLMVVARLSVAHLSIVCHSLLSSAIIPNKVTRTKVDTEARKARELCSRTLQETMSNEEACGHFVNWLYKEVAQEVGLSFIEFVQFKRMLRDELTPPNEANPVEEETAVAVVDAANTAPQQAEEAQPPFSGRYMDWSYPSAPRSSIVNREWLGMTQHDRHRAIAHELFAKYIETGSEFEINIAFNPRMAFTQMDSRNWQMDNEALCRVFDDALGTQERFMLSSLGRFKNWKLDQALKQEKNEKCEENGNGSGGKRKSVLFLTN